MKRVPIALATLGLMLTAGIATADSPHFINGNTSSSINSSGDLVVSFKEAGLGSGTTINYTLNASATAVYQCFNNGGKHPRAGNKETVQSGVTGTGTFTSGQAGNITGSITAGAPPGPGDFSCPNGQTLFLQSLSYFNITLTDTVNNISITPPDVSETLHVPVP